MSQAIGINIPYLFLAMEWNSSTSKTCSGLVKSKLFLKGESIVWSKQSQI